MFLGLPFMQDRPMVVDFSLRRLYNFLLYFNPSQTFHWSICSQGEHLSLQDLASFVCRTSTADSKPKTGSIAVGRCQSNSADGTWEQMITPCACHCLPVAAAMWQRKWKRGKLTMRRWGQRVAVLETLQCEFETSQDLERLALTSLTSSTSSTVVWVTSGKLTSAIQQNYEFTTRHRQHGRE